MSVADNSAVTADTVLKCRMPIEASATNGVINVACGSDVAFGNSIVYNYNAAEECSYHVYDPDGVCIKEFVATSAGTAGVSGGGFVVTPDMSRIEFSQNATLYKVFNVNVSDFIADVSSVTELQAKFDKHCVAEYIRQDVVNVYLDNGGSAGGGDTGDTSGGTGGTGNLSAYPPGAIYLSSIDTNPAALFGGTWKSLVGVFHESIFAWTRTVSASATCGTFLCGEVLCGQ